MSASYFDLLKYAATGQASPSMTYFDKMRASTLMGGAVQTLTGIPPLSFKSNGKPLISWSMKGNGYQTGTPTPDNPVMPTFCGARTGNLFNIVTITEDVFIRAGNISDSRPLGEIVSNVSYIASDFISVLPETEYTINYLNNYQSAAGAGAVFYDSTKTPLSGIPLSSQSKLFTFTTPQNAAYMRFSTYERDDSISNIMLNSGSTALPFEPFGYKIPISCGGENLFDSSTVTNNRYVSNSNGELVYYSGGSLCASDYINISGAAYVSITAQGGNEWGAFYDAEKAFISGISGYTNGLQVPDNAKYMRLTVKTAIFDSFMLNLGSTAKPYAPYSRQTTTVYLGQTQTVRRIKKLVLTGNETWIDWKGNYYSSVIDNTAISNSHLFCTHFTNDNTVGMNIVAGASRLKIASAAVPFVTSVGDLKTWLAAQYAAGHPVTVWYVLADPTTGIVNEPLCKIGTYADELSSTDAGVSIPTVKGDNVLTVDTPIQPSEMTITFKG